MLSGKAYTTISEILNTIEQHFKMKKNEKF